MVGILITSNVPQRASNENRHWKHVAPHQTELTILPQAMAETFCRHVLEGHQNYHYLHDWVGMFSPTEGSRAPVTMHHIELLGDTRSADDLGVFCTMPPERFVSTVSLRTVNDLRACIPTKRPCCEKLP